MSKEILVASPIWIMGTLKAKELNKSPVASARELKASSGTSHGILKLSKQGTEFLCNSFHLQ
jgi:hypothetical protein